MSEQLDHAATLDRMSTYQPSEERSACQAGAAALRDLECLRETGYKSARELYYAWNSADDECDKAYQRIAELDQFIAAHQKKVGSYAGWMIVEESADGSLLLNNLNDGTRRRIWNTSQERISELEGKLESARLEALQYRAELDLRNDVLDAIPRINGDDPIEQIEWLATRIAELEAQLKEHES